MAAGRTQALDVLSQVQRLKARYATPSRENAAERRARRQIRCSGGSRSAHNRASERTRIAVVFHAANHVMREEREPAGSSAVTEVLSSRAERARLSSPPEKPGVAGRRNARVAQCGAGGAQ